MEPLDLKTIVEPLLLWYAAQRRVLPWREEPTPYRVWISEIMLQQTRVEAGKPYFERFVAALPGIAQLAAAPEEQLLKLWQGLGYYNRVRNLQKAAKIVMEQYGGELPSSPEELQKLPGIGGYTAGAIASIAFGVPAPAVDGNVLRVWARLCASSRKVSDPAVKRRVEQEIGAVIPGGRAGDFTQALMELGALVCLPNGEPRCLFCPLRGLCRGFAQGLQGELPQKAEKKARRVEQRTVFLLTCQNLVALQKRPETGLLAGLWEFPSLSGRLTKKQAGEAVAAWGLEAEKTRPLPAAKHVFSHVEWRMAGYGVEVTSPGGGFVWAGARELREKYSVPSAFRAFTAFLNEEEAVSQGE